MTSAGGMLRLRRVREEDTGPRAYERSANHSARKAQTSLRKTSGRYPKLRIRVFEHLMVIVVDEL
jgi:hypothetical protein